MQDLLDDLHISGAALARYAGVSESTVYRWRHGSCPVLVMDMLVMLSEAAKRMDAIRDA